MIRILSRSAGITDVFTTLLVIGVVTLLFFILQLPIPFRSQQPVGYVFLSWTVRNPRDNAAMRGMIEALERENVGFFDYTQHQVDNSTDNSDEIRRNLEEAIKRADCSIEIVSGDILFHQWVQHERELLRKFEKRRFFLCLEESFLWKEGVKEQHITRLDFSGGKFGGDVHEEMMAMICGADVSYFESVDFKSQCSRLAGDVRFCLLHGCWDVIRNERDKGLRW